MYTNSLSFENYFSVDMYQTHRIALTRFRCAYHNLAINKLRPTHDRVDRIFKYCYENNHVNIIEDEYHFIFMCPLYAAERSFYIQSYFSHPSQGSFIDLFSSSCNSKIRNVAAYIYTMQAIYTMYIIPLFDSFKERYTVMTVCVFNYALMLYYIWAPGL